MMKLPVLSVSVVVITVLLLACLAIIMAAPTDTGNYTNLILWPSLDINSTPLIDVGLNMPLVRAMTVVGQGQHDADSRQHALSRLSRALLSVGNSWSGHYSPGWWSRLMQATVSPRQVLAWGQLLW